MFYLFNQFYLLTHLMGQESRKRIVFLIFLIFTTACLELFLVIQMAAFTSLFFGNVDSIQSFDLGLKLLPETTMFNNTNIMVVLLVLSYFFVAICNYQIIYNSNLYGIIISQNIVKNYLNKQFDDNSRESKQELKAQLFEDLHRTISGFVAPLISFFGKIVILVIFIIYLLKIEPYLTAVVFIFIFTLLFLMSKIMKKLIEKLSTTMTLSTEQRFISLDNIIEGLIYIKFWKKEGKYANSFITPTTNFYKSKTIAEFLSSLPRLVLEFIILLIIVLVLYLQSVDLLPVENSVLIIFLISMLKIAPAAQQSYSTLIQAKSHVTALDSILKSMSCKQNKSSSDNLLVTPVENNFLINEDINVDLNNDIKLVFKSNLVLKLGTWNSIIGPSGLGKSTLIQLVAGLRQFSLTNHSDNKRDTYRIFHNNEMDYMGEDFLISGSILENLSIEHETLDINFALDILENFELISELGATRQNILDYKINDRGINLSSGQKQRLMLTRSILSEKSILVLDEPTSALNQKLAEKIFRFMRLKLAEKTVFCVTHSDYLNKYFDKTIDLSDYVSKETNK
jgi:ABC-type bacteriocin/lantibiotic exporter with double-glycine peptidase domain